MMNNQQFKIMLVDDDTSFRDSVEKIIIREGFPILTAHFDMNILDLFHNFQPAIFILSIDFNELKKLEILKYIKDRRPSCKVIGLFKKAYGEMISELLTDEIFYDFIEKPFEIHQLLHRIYKASRDILLENNDFFLESGFSNFKKLKEFIKDSINKLPVGLIHINKRLKVNLCNNFAEKILCCSSLELMNLSLEELIMKFFNPCLFIEEICDSFISEKEFNFIILNSKKEEKIFDLSFYVCKSASGFFLFFRDLSEPFKIKQNVLLNNKKTISFEEIYEMFHNLKNKMTGIIAIASMIKKDVNYFIKKMTETVHQTEYGKLDNNFQINKEEIYNLTNTIFEENDRLINNLFEMDMNIRDFFKADLKCSEEIKMVNINDLLKDAVTFVQPYFKKKEIKLIDELYNELPLILVNPDKLKEVFVEILLNACDSIPEDKKGTVKCKTLIKENNIIIIIQDTGTGFKEKLDFIFFPFYTTKENGNGLGLVNVKNIIKEYNGNIFIKSIQGYGTLFQIQLPVQ